MLWQLYDLKLVEGNYFRWKILKHDIVEHNFITTKRTNNNSIVTTLTPLNVFGYGLILKILLLRVFECRIRQYRHLLLYSFILGSRFNFFYTFIFLTYSVSIRFFIFLLSICLGCKCKQSFNEKSILWTWMINNYNSFYLKTFWKKFWEIFKKSLNSPNKKSIRFANFMHLNKLKITLLLF